MYNIYIKSLKTSEIEIFQKYNLCVTQYCVMSFFCVKRRK